MTKSRDASVFSESPLQLSAIERSEATRFSVPVASVVQCCRPLEMAFFFDGTRNNLKYDESFETHSNVAKLSQVLDDVRRFGEDKDFRYRTYVPGVRMDFRQKEGANAHRDRERCKHVNMRHIFYFAAVNNVSEWQ